jgi:hypothetical protein
MVEPSQRDDVTLNVQVAMDDGVPAAHKMSMSPEDLARVRQAVLDDLGMTYDDLYKRVLAYTTLRPREREAYDTIRAIDHLLNGQPPEAP